MNQQVSERGTNMNLRISKINLREELKEIVGIENVEEGIRMKSEVISMDTSGFPHHPQIGRKRTSGVQYEVQ
jgi:hypothetical protein